MGAPSVSPEGVEPSNPLPGPAPQAGVYANSTTVTYRGVSEETDDVGADGGIRTPKFHGV
jgi:hypothetical protein